MEKVLKSGSLVHISNRKYALMWYYTKREAHNCETG
jgi:hypothetical protein